MNFYSFGACGQTVCFMCTVLTESCVESHISSWCNIMNQLHHGTACVTDPITSEYMLSKTRNDPLIFMVCIAVVKPTFIASTTVVSSYDHS